MSEYNQEIKNVSERYKHVKKITQILLPLSVFSLLSSSLAPLFLDSYAHLLSDLSSFNFNFKIKLFTYTTERNCIFLICNGILVFIIQSSGLISKITPVQSIARSDDHRADKDYENARFEESKKKGVEKVEILEEKIADFAAEVGVDLQDLEVEKWGEEEEEVVVNEHEYEDGEIDTEELKKKCEEFIKKVKLEIQGA